MIRFLAHSALTLLANAVGLAMASLLLPGFHIDPIGFVVSVAFFTVVEIVFGPFVFKMAVKYLPALRGGIALITTLVGLLLTVTFTSGLKIDDVKTWVIAPLVIWLSVVIAGIILPLFLFKTVLEEARSKK